MTTGESIANLEVLSNLCCKARATQQLHRTYEGEITSTKELPRDYHCSLLQLHFNLSYALQFQANNLREEIHSSPPMRRHFVQMETGPDAGKIAPLSPPNASFSQAVRILYLMEVVWQERKGKACGGLRPEHAIDELEGLIQSDPEIQSLISPRISNRIGDLSIISQCLTQLNLYQPWARRYPTIAHEFQEPFTKEYETKLWPIRKILLAINHNPEKIIPLGNPSDGRFAYPAKKRATREVEEVGNVIRDHASGYQGTQYYRLISEGRVLHRTPEWTEPQREEKGAKAPETTEFVPIFNPTPVDPPHRDFPVPKRKVKTKGIPRAEATPEPNLPSSTAANVPIETADNRAIPVDARSLKVFRALFFCPDVTSTPGEVSWTDFLHAMVSAGFQAEKLYGSVWAFKSNNPPHPGSIQFHEPHPRGKLSFTTARRIGRRLDRAYGWSISTFTLKKTET
ncbi:hypothetical protein jhhlp_008504 [Lomentospora prolificans]|uniref:Uncharacterized protein n=1 Tax=Lomentospora prolificans TaxID=41688 RepID=A0A2N3MY86_9PEZI|nr:hypothetical protein jhhlp_008504 [Lomentospora prolificans]